MDAVASLDAGGRQARFATRAAFFVAGLGVAAWAPLVPYARARLGIDEATLGALLFCLGLGSLVAMPLTGWLVGRLGCRAVILASGLTFSAVLPSLAVISSLPAFAAALALFGASLGVLDVAINIHAVLVERGSPKPLMSGFHGLFSAGGFAGAAGTSVTLALGVAPLSATLAVVAVLVAALAVSHRHFLRRSAEAPRTPAFAMPHGIVVLLGLLCFVVFLTEGALLDWSALLLIDARGFEPAWGGLGYAAFAAAMTVGRLTGDRVVHAVGGLPVLVVGGLLAASGFAAALLAPFGWLALAGFALIGIGSANIVPVLFSAAGRQTRMPANLAIAAITTLGYAGVLAGPAALGFIAEAAGLAQVFALLGVAMLVVPLTARIAVR